MLVGKEKDKKDQSSETVPRPLFEINSANFPPLLSQADESTIPTPGYKDNFVKYSFDEIITIVKTVKEAILPPPFNPVCMHRVFSYAHTYIHIWNS